MINRRKLKWFQNWRLVLGRQNGHFVLPQILECFLIAYIIGFGLHTTSSLNKTVDPVLAVLSLPRDIIPCVSCIVIGWDLIYSKCSICHCCMGSSCVLITSFKVPSTTHALKETNHFPLCVCQCAVCVLTIVETS